MIFNQKILLTINCSNHKTYAMHQKYLKIAVALSLVSVGSANAQAPRGDTSINGTTPPALSRTNIGAPTGHLPTPNAADPLHAAQIKAITSPMENTAQRFEKNIQVIKPSSDAVGAASQEYPLTGNNPKLDGKINLQNNPPMGPANLIKAESSGDIQRMNQRETSPKETIKKVGRESTSNELNIEFRRKEIQAEDVAK